MLGRADNLNGELLLYIIGADTAGAGALLSTTSATASWIGSALGAIGVVMPIVIPLWIAGDTLAVVIPMLPYVMWFGVCIGWMILCLEAMIAAPLWVVTHLHPDGDGVVGRGGAGYGLVLSLTMRPALMITGLIAAYTMLPILGGILNETFSGAFGMVAGGNIGIIESLAFIAVYIAMMFTVVKKSLSLIHVIPDEIMKWLGVHGGQQMGGYAQSASKGVESAVFTQSALNQVSHASNSANNLTQKLQHKKEMERQQTLANQAQLSGRVQQSESAFRNHMNTAGPLDKQDETQSRQTAATAYNAAQAAQESGDIKGYSERMDVAQKAADRAVSFDPANRDLLPGDLGKTAKPIEGFNMLGKGGGDSSGETDTKPTSGSNIE